MFDTGEQLNTVFDLITAHTPVNAQSGNYSLCAFIYFCLKAYVVGFHLTCWGNSNEYQHRMLLEINQKNTA